MNYFVISIIDEDEGKDKETWVSGLNQHLAKVSYLRVPRVRISPSPPLLF